MASDAELISLMSHTLGSIGQIVKDVNTLPKVANYEKHAYEEIKRIYGGYVEAIKQLTRQD